MRARRVELDLARAGIAPDDPSLYDDPQPDADLLGIEMIDARQR